MQQTLTAQMVVFLTALRVAVVKPVLAAPARQRFQAGVVTLYQQSAAEPKARQCIHQSQAAIGTIIGVVAPCKRGKKIVAVMVQPLKPRALLWALQLHFGLKSEREETGEVAFARGVLFTRRRQPLQRELTHRFEHAVAHHAIGIGLDADKRFFDQRAQVVKHGPGIGHAQRCHLLRGIEAKGAGHHAQSAEHCLLFH